MSAECGYYLVLLTLYTMLLRSSLISTPYYSRAVHRLLRFGHNKLKTTEYAQAYIAASILNVCITCITQGLLMSGSIKCAYACTLRTYGLQGATAHI